MSEKEHKTKYEITKEFQKIINKAKIGLMSQHNSAFICTILFSLKLIWFKSIPTAGVDGISLFINPDFFIKLNEEERIGLLAHESWHVAFQHMLRLGNRDKEKFNVAADHVINLMLAANYYSLPDGALKDTKYINMTTEKVYDLLPDQPTKPDMQDLIYIDDSTINLSGDVKDSTVDKIKKEADIKNIIIRASIQSKINGDKAGSIPGEIQIEIDKIVNPKLNWRTILNNFMQAFATNDYSMINPNRRFFPDYYLPSLKSESLLDIAVAIDTSGSVSDEEISHYLAEINNIHEQFKPKKLKIISFDASIRNTYIVTPDMNIKKLKFKGRGGTDLKPVFKYMDKSKPNLLIVFSDLYCGKIKEKPNYSVIWVVVNNNAAKVNFGKMIKYET